MRFKLNKFEYVQEEMGQGPVRGEGAGVLYRGVPGPVWWVPHWQSDWHKYWHDWKNTFAAPLADRRYVQEKIQST